MVLKYLTMVPELVSLGVDLVRGEKPIRKIKDRLDPVRIERKEI